MKRLLLAVLMLSLTASARPSHIDKNYRVYDLRCENLVNPLGMDNTSPHFSWKLASHKNGARQTAYELQVATDSLLLSSGKADLWQSGRVTSDRQVMLPYGGHPLRSRMLCWWRVRSWNGKGRVSAWSPVARFSVGLLDGGDFTADYIGMDKKHGDLHAPLIRKDITLDTVGTSFLHVNSLGYHEVYVNGRKVGDAVLAPAVSQLTLRSQIVTYDVSPYLHRGLNTIVLWIGQGWYKSTTFKAQYEGPLVRAELDMLRDGRWHVLARTDSTWRASESGYRDTGTWTALMFGGERVDGSLVPTSLGRKALDLRTWSPVAVVKVKGMTATPQMCEANVISRRTHAVSVQPLPDGSWLADMGRVLTGWFRLKMPKLERGQTVTMEYADALDKDGTFKSQGESDCYLSAGREGETFCNKFNHHAYRYVRITGLPARPDTADMAALQISGGYRETGSFACSDIDITAIHDMVKYTLRCLNFSGYMVDCPHLERMGYGGDGNSSTMSVQTMYDVAPAYYNWLTAWGDVIGPDGSLPYVAPAGGGGGGPWWNAFMVKSPWRTYLNYGDDRILRQRYADMQKWLDYVEKYSPDGLLQPWSDTPNRMWWLGDWLAPADVDVGGRSPELVNNCVVSDCYATMARMATALGKDDDARMYARKRQDINQLIHHAFFHVSDTTYANGTPLDMSYALLVGAVPEELYDKVKAKLVHDIRTRYKEHMAAGLVGVAVFTDWMTRDRQADLMYRLLKKRDYPGYLYMMDHGATATWEYWSGERSHVHNCYNGIGTWFYEALGGLLPDPSAAGYKHFFVDPQYAEAVSWTRVEKETPYGTIRISWRKSGKKTTLDVDVPVGSTATVILPARQAVTTGGGQKTRRATRKQEVGSGRHHLVFTSH